MSVAQLDVGPGLKRAGRRAGYAIAVIINVALLVIVGNLLDWGWAPFLTEEFADVVPWIGLSLILSIVANLVYQFDDRPEVKSVGQILINLVSIFATYQIFIVFPFDFTSYAFDWATVARILLVLAMVGAGIGVLTETIRLVSGEREQERRRPMTASSETRSEEAVTNTATGKRLYRSEKDRVLGGVCAGLGEYFAVDPIWFRIGFVVLAIGGGSGILIYLLMWLIVPSAPEAYEPPSTGQGAVTGSAIVGLVFVIVGTIALVNTATPWLGQYVWPVIFILGGLALAIGGLQRDNHR